MTGTTLRARYTSRSDGEAVFWVDTSRAYPARAHHLAIIHLVDGIDQDQSGRLVKTRSLCHLCALLHN